MLSFVLRAENIAKIQITSRVSRKEEEKNALLLPFRGDLYGKTYFSLRQKT
jgi:hypothetical protein